MNRLSLKVKLTMLYTFFMILVTCAALAILFSLSSREVLSSTRAKLERQVQNSTDDVGLRDGVPAVNRDFYSVEDNVYLSLYDETGYFLLGRNPYGFDSRPEIRDGQVEIIRAGDTSWYVYDMSFRLSRETTVFIRGVTSCADPSAGHGAGYCLHRLPVYQKDTSPGPPDHRYGAEDPGGCGSFQTRGRTGKWREEPG